VPVSGAWSPPARQRNGAADFEELKGIGSSFRWTQLTTVATTASANKTDSARARRFNPGDFRKDMVEFAVTVGHLAAADHGVNPQACRLANEPAHSSNPCRAQRSGSR
jgi:hypothetical protein